MIREPGTINTWHSLISIGKICYLGHYQAFFFIVISMTTSQMRCPINFLPSFEKLFTWYLQNINWKYKSTSSYSEKKKIENLLSVYYLSPVEIVSGSKLYMWNITSQRLASNPFLFKMVTDTQSM